MAEVKSIKSEILSLLSGLILVLAGMVAGIINTLAGNGSAVTLTVLVSMGLPANVANGTNRIGVLSQSFTGWYTFYKNGLWDAKAAKWIIPVTIVGALTGTLLAVEISEAWLHPILGTLMVLLLIQTLLNPKQWLQGQQDKINQGPTWLKLIMFFCVGFYGGFIQAGVGVLLLSALVMGIGYDLKMANGLKIGIVALYTIPVLALFVYHGQVNWLLGILLAIGQSIGAWIAARFALKQKNAVIWIRRLLIAVLIFGIVKFFHLSTLISSLL